MIYEKLAKIQKELKAPKSLYNSYGGYKYRNAESILESVKPFEEKYQVCLTIQDDLVQIGDRYYIKAIATIIDLEDLTNVTVSAYARESESKKGMDASQITGSTSSYARKYALNGLFLLDDTKDADTNEYYEQTTGKKSQQGYTTVKKSEVESIASLNKQKDVVKSLCEQYGVDLNAWLERNDLNWDTITANDLARMNKTLQARFNKAS